MAWCSLLVSLHCCAGSVNHVVLNSNLKSSWFMLLYRSWYRFNTYTWRENTSSAHRLKFFPCISKHILPVLTWWTFFWAAWSFPYICSSLKIKHQNKVELAQISETHYSDSSHWLNNDIRMEWNVVQLQLFGLRLGRLQFQFSCCCGPQRGFESKFMFIKMGRKTSQIFLSIFDTVFLAWLFYEEQSLHFIHIFQCQGS